jgi:hypothetical protein
MGLIRSIRAGEGHRRNRPTAEEIFARIAAINARHGGFPPESSCKNPDNIPPPLKKLIEK